MNSDLYDAIVASVKDIVENRNIKDNGIVTDIHIKEDDETGDLTITLSENIKENIESSH